MSVVKSLFYALPDDHTPEIAKDIHKRLHKILEPELKKIAAERGWEYVQRIIPRSEKRTPW